LNAGFTKAWIQQIRVLAIEMLRQESFHILSNDLQNFVVWWSIVRCLPLRFSISHCHFERSGIVRECGWSCGVEKPAGPLAPAKEAWFVGGNK
jgi:hypothetical protein